MCHVRRQMRATAAGLAAYEKRGGARCDQALVQPGGDLFPAREKRQEVAPMTSSDKKKAMAETTTLISAGQFAGPDA